VSTLAVQYLILALVPLSSLSALAQSPSTAVHGNWTATAASGEALQGTWTAQLSPAEPNAAQGSWTLLNGAGELALQGTWAARKTGQSWKGTWTARSQPSRSWSGTWTAAVRDLSAKVFQDMLRLAAKGQTAGSWRSGPYRGNWWLTGATPRS